MRCFRRLLSVGIGVGVLAVGLVEQPTALADVPAVPSMGQASNRGDGAVLEVRSLSDGTVNFRSEQSEFVVHPAKGPGPSNEELILLAPQFGCRLNVQHVHGSVHVAGTINGVAKVECDIPAGSLALHYSLIRVSPNNTQWAATSQYNTGKSWIQNNKAVNCNQGPGMFQGWAQGELTPPPGYVLSGPPAIEKWGGARAVTCGAALRSTGFPAVSSEVMTVTFVRSYLVE